MCLLSAACTVRMIHTYIHTYMHDVCRFMHACMYVCRFITHSCYSLSSHEACKCNSVCDGCVVDTVINRHTSVTTRVSLYSCVSNLVRTKSATHTLPTPTMVPTSRLMWNLATASWSGRRRNAVPLHCVHCSYASTDDWPIGVGHLCWRWTWLLNYDCCIVGFTITSFCSQRSSFALTVVLWYDLKVISSCTVQIDCVIVFVIKLCFSYV